MKVTRKIVSSLNSHKIDSSYVKAHKKHREDHQNEYLLIDEIVSKFRATGGLKFEHQAYKLWELSKLLQAHSPTSILEFGSGSSSLVFSDYARKNQSTFLSIDEDPKWASNTAKLINIDKNDRIEVRQAEKIIYPNRTPVEIKYEFNTQENFDFVLIDGPSLSAVNTKIKEAVNSNFIDLKELPKVIVVDVRKATAEYIAQRYSDVYNCTLSDIFNRKTVEAGYQYFSVFEKKIA